MRIAKMILSPSVVSAVSLALVVLLGGCLSYRYNAILKQNRDLVVHTYQVISAVERAFSDIQDAETGQRGFVITGDEKYLNPYRNAVQNIPVSLHEIRRLVADRSEQLDRADNFENALHGKLDELSVTIALRRDAGLDAARNAIVQADGIVAMDRIRAVVAQMILTEEDLLSDRTSTVVHQERNVLLIALLGALVSIATRVAVELIMWRRRGRQTAKSTNVIRSRQSI
jgi:CHASE3 domain sensor protein